MASVCRQRRRAEARDAKKEADKNSRKTAFSMKDFQVIMNNRLNFEAYAPEAYAKEMEAVHMENLITKLMRCSHLPESVKTREQVRLLALQQVEAIRAKAYLDEKDTYYIRGCPVYIWEAWELPLIEAFKVRRRAEAEKARKVRAARDHFHCIARSTETLDGLNFEEECVHPCNAPSGSKQYNISDQLFFAHVEEGKMFDQKRAQLRIAHRKTTKG